MPPTPAPIVTIHAPEPDALARARSSARNLRAAAPNALIEIVVNAAGVAAALDENGADPETDALLVYCSVTLGRLNRAAPEGARVARAAIAHLVARQAEGWAYIRA